MERRERTRDKAKWEQKILSVFSLEFVSYQFSSRVFFLDQLGYNVQQVSPKSSRIYNMDWKSLSSLVKIADPKHYNINL